MKSGMADAAIAGGTEAPLTKGNIMAWESMKVMSRSLCRPFAKGRDGLIIAEGAGALVLESEEHARTRGRDSRIELAGFGGNADARDMVAPKIEGMAGSMRLALESAGLDASEIDYVNAHGTATRANDIAESAAMKQVSAIAVAGFFDKIRPRPHARRGGRAGGGGDRARHAARRRAADGELRRARSRMRPRLCAERAARAENSRRAVELLRVRRPQLDAGVPEALMSETGSDAKAGEALGASEWVEVSQARINLFAEATGDQQFLHVDPTRAAAETPFGGTIAHGYLILSMLPQMCGEVLRLSEHEFAINFGLEKLRFQAPVRTGKRIRAHLIAGGRTVFSPTKYALKLGVSVEIEGEPTAALTVERLTLIVQRGEAGGGGA